MPSPTSGCSSYWKGSLRVALDFGHQLYFIYVKAKIDKKQQSSKYRLFSDNDEMINRNEQMQQISTKRV